MSDWYDADDISEWGDVTRKQDLEHLGARRRIDHGHPGPQDEYTAPHHMGRLLPSATPRPEEGVAERNYAAIEREANEEVQHGGWTDREYMAWLANRG